MFPSLVKSHYYQNTREQRGSWVLYLQLKWLDSCPLDLHGERCVLVLLHSNNIFTTNQADNICCTEKYETVLQSKSKIDLVASLPSCRLCGGAACSCDSEKGLLYTMHEWRWWNNERKTVMTYYVPILSPAICRRVKQSLISVTVRMPDGEREFMQENIKKMESGVCLLSDTRRTRGQAGPSVFLNLQCD